jgi:hypothetical protein
MRRRLGKRRALEAKRERMKALPERYPNEGPCGLAEAYDQLTKPAFAIWIRMAVAERPELRAGRAKLSRLLGYSRRQGDELLRELERKGFVAFIPHGPWRRTVVVLVRRPLLERGHSFTRFARFLFSPISEMHFRQLEAGKSVSSSPSNAYRWIGAPDIYPRSFSQLPVSFTHLPISPATYQCRSVALHKSIAIGAFAENRSRGNMAASTPRVIRRKFVTEDSYFDALAAYRDLIGSIKLEERERRKVLRSSTRERRERRNAANRARGVEVLDWAELDTPRKLEAGETDLDLVTFDPRQPKHALMRKVLARKSRDPERVKLVKRLESEFCRLYSRYRRAAERAHGKSVVTYWVSDKERKYAAQAGVLCVQRGVTPRQLMEFWHANIKHFRRASGMQVPSLAFLSGVANIDTVACGLVFDETAPGGARIGTSEPANDVRPRAGNSFSDTGRLDVRLRAGLEAAGFSTRELNDRYLLTVQKNALGLAAGRDIFIGKGPLRDMSRWAASNLYAK